MGYIHTLPLEKKTYKNSFRTGNPRSRVQISRLLRGLGNIIPIPECSPRLELVDLQSTLIFKSLLLLTIRASFQKIFNELRLQLKLFLKGLWKIIKRRLITLETSHLHRGAYGKQVAYCIRSRRRVNKICRLEPSAARHPVIKEFISALLSLPEHSRIEL